MHGGIPPGSDAGGPAADAGFLCEARGASVLELRCPMGVPQFTPASVFVSTSPTACCSSGTVRQRVSSRGNEHTIALEWDACDCCEACRCVGPIEELTVDLGADLAPGRHTVTVAGSTCSFEVLPEPAPDCRPGPATAEVRAPTHLLEGQPYATTLTADALGSCSCRPRIAGAESLVYSIELCDCCDACDCIDQGYQIGHVRTPLDVGTHPVSFPGTPETVVSVHARAGCQELAVTALTYEPPRDDLTQGGERLHWVRVDGEALVCCATPIPVVEPLDTTDGSIAVRLLSCHEFDCDCEPPGPTPTGQWVSLGELGSGAHRVTAGAQTLDFVVP